MAQVTTRRASSAATVFFMIAAVACAAAAAWVLSTVLERKYSGDPVQSLVVVKSALPAGQTVAAEALRLAEWPKSAIPDGAFSRIEDALKDGRVPLIPLVRGEPLLRSQLSKAHAGFGIAALMERGKRAVAVPCADQVTLSRLVYPGARVDVLSTINDEDAEGHALLKTRVVLQDVKVLAVGEDIDPVTIAARRASAARKDDDAAAASTQDDAAAERQARGVVTLLVTPEQASILTLAARDGHLDLSLRHPDDHAEVVTSTFSRLRFAGDELDADPEAALSGAGPGATGARASVIQRRRASPNTAAGRERRGATLQESPAIRILRSSDGQ
ncbi:MAG: Flp pilus assembly protein CpaB [Proteobacteria bacterium]|nr:Flp pilus assembly protein CpaB [Pseudomonadota bacterium]